MYSYTIPVLITNIRAFKMHLESLKQHNSCPIAGTCVYILFLPKQWKFWTICTRPFLFHYLICHYSTKALSLHLTNEKEESERIKGLWFLPAFPFLLCHQFRCTQMASHGSDMIERRYSGFLRYIYFLEGHCLLFAFEAGSCLNRKWSLWRLLILLLNCRHNMPNLVLLCLPNSHSLWIHWNSVLGGRHHKCMYEWMTKNSRMWWQEMADRHIICSFIRQLHAPYSTDLHFQSQNSKKKKKKLMTVSWWQQSIKPRLVPFCVCALCDSTGHKPMKTGLPLNFILVWYIRWKINTFCISLCWIFCLSSRFNLCNLKLLCTPGN